MNSHEKFKEDMEKAGYEIIRYLSEDYEVCPSVLTFDIAKTLSRTSVECSVEIMGNCWIVFPRHKEEVPSFESIDDPYGTPPNSTTKRHFNEK